MKIYYPKGLPLGLRSSRSTQITSPLQRSELSSGRARQRRRFTSVPVMTKVSFLFDGAQGRTFEAWYRDQLKDGELWFECPLKTPMGLEDYTCRFTDIYQGPNPVGPNLWSYSADIELRERAIMPPGWGEFPDFILMAGIIDYAMNKEWPLAVPGPSLLTESGQALLTESGNLLSLEN